MAVAWTEKVVLAPMSKGSNLPFRRLCTAFGVRATMSEMVFAASLAKGSRFDAALMRKHGDEHLFGAQILASKPDVAVEAALKAQDLGVDWVDLNAGCPIREVLSKGCGARLLERPAHLQAICAALVQNLHIPVTVKLRTGPKAEERNYLQTTQLAEEAGVSGIAVHGRDRQQRYTGCADWQVVREVARARQIPVLGNGDILTWYEAEDKLALSGAYGIMVGRGALIKPWIFQEIAEKRDILPTAEERVAIYLRLASYMLEHFGDDERGRKSTQNFLTWHGDFFCRYRPLPELEYRLQSREYPLIQTRLPLPNGEDKLEYVLAVQKGVMHQRLAQILLDGALEHRSEREIAEEMIALYEWARELTAPRVKEVGELQQDKME